MLSKESVIQARHILDAAKYNGRPLQPINGSPLASIVSTLSSFNEVGTDEELINQSNTTNTSMGNHDELEERVVKIISKRMGSIIDVAKNVVNPHCLAIIKRINDVRNANALTSVGIISNIKQVEIPELFTDSLFDDLLVNYIGTIPKTINNTSDLFNSLLNTLNEEDYDNLIKIGTPNFDNKVDEFFKNKFKSGIVLKDSLDVPSLTLTDAVWLFLVFTGINNVRIDKVSGIVDNYDNVTIITKIIASTGAKITQDIKFLFSLIEKGDIVLKNELLGPTPKDVLPVLSVNYKRWIKDNNGSPEAAIGYYIAHGKTGIYNDNELVTNPDSYKDKYIARLSQAKALSIIEDIALVRRETGYYLADVISKMEEVNRVRLQQQLNKALEHEYHGANNLSQYLIKVVSRALYANGSRDLTSEVVANDRDASHDIKDLLIEIESILLESPDKDYKYAENIASIRLVTRWIAKLIVRS